MLEDELDTLVYWIRQRENIRIARLSGDKPPWSTDPILNEYRWCNVRRMDDKVSQWLLGWHREHNARIQDRTVAALAGRLINWPDTLATLPYPAPFREVSWTSGLFERENRGMKVFTGAYIINGALGGPKILQVTQKILQPIWDDRQNLPAKPRTMQEVFNALNGKPGIGSFMAGQAVADLRHIHPELPWEDRLTWAPQGPGSIRGVNRLLGRKLESRMPYSEWLDVVRRAYAHAASRLPLTFRRLELMDMQNCLCEYDKYQRLSRNEGTVRSRYKGT